MLEEFIKKIKNGYWQRGSVWEFDWYLDVFFVEEMAYGKNPFSISYKQAVIGDEFLALKNEGKIIKKFSNFFKKTKNYKSLIKKQNEIIDSANNLLTSLKNGASFNPKKYEKIQKNLSLLMASVSVVFDYLIPKEIKRISKEEKTNHQLITNYIIDNSSHTKLNESNKELLKLYQKNEQIFEKSGFKYSWLPVNLKKELSAHQKKYGWLNTGEKGSQEWNENDFLLQLKELKKKMGKKRGKTLRIDRLSKKNRDLLNAFIKINFNDNVAADKQIELDFLFQKYLKSKLGKNYDENILENLTYQEIVKLLNCPLNILSFKNRKNNIYRLVWPGKKKVNFYYFKNKHQFDQVMNLIGQKSITNRIVSGSIACSGVAEGKVRIIRGQTDLNDFQKGEIMIASQTQPKYVVAMMKASAIVTDVGGITSHAAIISREYGVPCIVGTNNATAVFKTGEYVLVDAEKGMVTKI